MHRRRDPALPAPPAAEVPPSRSPRARAFLRAYPWIALAVAVGLGALAARTDGGSPAARLDEAAAADVEAFTQPGCPHCEAARAFLDRLRADRPATRVVVWDLVRDRPALRRLEALAKEAGAAVLGTPALRVGRTLVVGWRDPETGDVVRDLLAGGGSAAGALPQGGRCPVGLDEDEAAPREPECVTAIAEDARGAGIDLPWIGRVSVADAGLPLFTVAVGLVDGFNPCAMWVLLFILSLLVHLRSRSRMLAIAGTFLLASGLCYFAFMAAWLTFFDLVGHVRVVQVVLGVLALFVGAIHAKDFVAFHEGVSLSIPASVRPGLTARVVAVLRANRLAGAMLGVVALAFLVNTVELLCTAGLPAVYTAVLAQHDLSGLQHYGYLALYQLAYMLDDGLVLLVAVVTLSHRKLQATGGRWMKLVSGVVVATLGGLLLFRPEWLYW